MRVEQRTWTGGRGWQPAATSVPDAHLVLVFGGGAALHSDALARLAAGYSQAAVVGCSTAGEIAGTKVTDDGIVATAVRFSSARIRAAHVDLGPGEDSHVAGRRLARQLLPEGLVHVLVLSDGQRVNGSRLAEGMAEGLPQGVQVTGGLAGDGARFQHTYTVVGDGAREGRIVAVGFYGKNLRVGFGSLGGWDPFGPQRRITRSEGNVLYELDGRPALELYKSYLGEQAAGLPATGLLFPLSVQEEAGGTELVRTILGVDEARQSLTFAGDMPQGAMARLMKANFDRLVDGAQGAARATQGMLGGGPPELAILISCVGRKLVLKQRVEDEVDAVQEVLGRKAVLSGFYSYGEICPAAPRASCELHNQTMTITTFCEHDAQTA